MKHFLCLSCTQLKPPHRIVNHKIDMDSRCLRDYVTKESWKQIHMYIDIPLVVSETQPVYQASTDWVGDWVSTHSSNFAVMYTKRRLVYWCNMSSINEAYRIAGTFRELQAILENIIPESLVFFWQRQK